MLFLLRRKVNKLLQKDEKINYSKKVFFHLKNPSGKFFHNPEVPGTGLATPGGLVSSAGLFFTSRGRIILIGSRTRNNFFTSPYTEILLDLSKDQIEKVTVNDSDIDTGGFSSKGILLKITTKDKKSYELGVGGIGFNKIFDILKIYTFEQARQSIKKPVLDFLKDKLSQTS